MAAWHDRDVKAGTLAAAAVITAGLLLLAGLGIGLWSLWTEVLAGWPT